MAECLPEQATLIVIFGSRVMPNGEPSGSLRRRVQGAAALAQNTAHFLVTGGRGSEELPTEAAVMTRLLIELGIDETHILADHASTDTLDSIDNCARIIRSLKPARVIACSDRYHVPRVLLLFRLAGVRAQGGWIASGRRATGSVTWLGYWIRDMVALVYDATIMLFRPGKGKT